MTWESQIETHTTKPVTLKQIATAVNKTAVTVSKALRDHPDISPNTKAQIIAMARKLGYTPNLIARKLSSRETRTIGLVVPKVAHSFFAQAVEAIHDEAHGRGYDIFMMISGEDPGTEAHHIRTLLSLQVDGFLLSVTQETEDLEIVNAILRNRKQMVFFDRLLEGVDCSCVVCDNYHGSYKLVSFVLENGYRDLGYLSGYTNSYIGRERRRGFEQALADKKIAINPDWIVEGGFDKRDGYAGLKKIKDSGTLPQLICTCSFSSATGALQAAHELGLSVPGDIDIVSFGDSTYNLHMSPSLTAVQLDAREMGRKALDLLIQQLGRPDIPSQQVVVPTKLVVNETGLGPGLRRNGVNLGESCIS